MPQPTTAQDEEKQRAQKMRELLANPPANCRVVQPKPGTVFGIVGYPPQRSD
jgi:hypothetical protein